MKRIRVIPVLLLQKGGLVKTIRFKKPTYLGDPINAVRIFNEKEVDELAIIDISATREKKFPNFPHIQQIASESFMPFAYGGGINSIDQIKKIFQLGVEKVIINTEAFKNPNLISEASKLFGSQSIVVSIDVKRNLWGKYTVNLYNGTHDTRLDPVKYAKKMEDCGAGEIFLNSIDRDGTYQGYDTILINTISSALKIPLVACGGAGKIDDFTKAITEGKASAVAAGSIFVYQGPQKGILISYPSQETLREKVFKNV